jgi:hypothetical protein
MSSNTTYYNPLTSGYCATSYMFRPIHMAIFRLLREDVFYNTVQLLYTTTTLQIYYNYTITVLQLY